MNQRRILPGDTPPSPFVGPPIVRPLSAHGSSGHGQSVFRAQREGGFALVLVLIFTFLLYILITELVTGARMVRISGENDALLARMRNHMAFTLDQVNQALIDDVASGGEEGGADPLPEGGGGGLPGAGAGAEGAGLGGEGEGEEESPAAVADCSQDTWFEPQSYADGELTTYTWAEDENHKFNLLALLSADEEFARASRDRVIRIVDALREGTQYDLTMADGESLVREFLDFQRSGSRTEDIPLAPLKSFDQERPDITLPLHLDELKFLRSVTDDVFYDKVLDGRVIQGFESVFTIYTSQVYDPGDPQKNATRQAEGGVDPSGDPAEGAGDPEGSGAVAGGGAEGEEAPAPEGQGIRININTVSRAVLRGMFSPAQVPDSVIDAILRYRNEVEDEQGDEFGQAVEDYAGDVDLGMTETKKVFSDMSALEDLPEFANIADPAIKDEFNLLFDTKSDVFTIHMAAMVRRSERERIYVLRRMATVVMRRGEGEEAELHPLVPLEDRRGLRLPGQDFPEESADLYGVYSEMDSFAQEERAWNPFFVEFYLPQEERDEFYDPSRVR